MTCLIALAVGGAALASTPEVHAQPERPGASRGRFGVSFGVASREGLQRSDEVPVRFSGGASNLEASFAYFGSGAFGFSADLGAEWFVAKGRDLAGNDTTLRLAGFQLWPAGAARWAGASGLSAEALLGYGYGTAPSVEASSRGITAAGVSFHGPFAGLGLAYEGEGLLSGTLTGRAMPFGARSSRAFAAGGELAIGRLQLAGFVWAATVGYELTATSIGRAEEGLSTSAHRVALGVRATAPRPSAAPIVAAPPPPDPEPPRVEPPRTPTGPGKIRGVVLAASDKPGERLPLAGAELHFGGVQPVQTGPDGSFEIPRVGPGPVPLRITAKGFKEAEEVVAVPPEAEAVVELSLQKAAAKQLATIRGLIRSVAGAPVEALIRIPEANARVRAKADGRFVMNMPGGKYTVTIEADGYVSQRRVVEVADGDQAIFHVDLKPAP